MPEHGPALSHKPCFNYSGTFEGNFYNWGFGPAFTLSHEEDDYTSNPSLTYDNTTVYLIGWHIHTPADHTVAASRARAERTSRASTRSRRKRATSSATSS